MDEAVDWETTPETTPFLAGLWLLAFSGLGGLAVLVGGGIVFLLASFVLDGRVATVLALVVAAALSWRVSLAAVRVEGSGVLPAGVPRRWVGVGSLLGAGLLVLAARLHPAGVGVVLAAALVVAGLAGVSHSRGQVAPGADELRVGDPEVWTREVPLRELSGVRTVSVRGLTWCHLSYVRGGGGLEVPRVLAMPTGTFEHVRPALQAGVDADAGVERVDRAVRVVAGLVSLSVLATGPALWLAARWAGTPVGAESGLVFGLLAASPLGLVGLLLLWYALTA